MLDFLNIRIRITVKQSLSRHNHSRCAISTLDSTGEHICFLNEMRVIRGAESFNCDNISAFKADYFSQAGTDRFPI